jgi:autotransporter strand-loop-strand O-heptosyltransferase
MGIQIYGHTSFLGVNGYNAHSQAFFTHLNNFIPVRIRNYTYTKQFSDFEKKYLHLLVEQDWQDSPYKIGTPFTPNPNDTLINLILNESHHYYFYDHYSSPKIAYNVWESTRQLPEFFNKILEYDQFWCPTEWQKMCTIEQGCPVSKVKVVNEGVDGNTFHPSFDRKIKTELYNKYNIPQNAFTYLIFGRWDYRKSIQEMVEIFHKISQINGNIYLILSADNPFSSDGLTTEQRLKNLNIQNERIKVLHFPPRHEYIQWLQHGDCLLSCSRAEGWNLPLIESLACGTPSIYSNWGGHVEFADGIGYPVSVPKELPPKNVFMIGDTHDLGVWGEPDFDEFESAMISVYKKYDYWRERTLKLSRFIRKSYTWENAALQAKKHIEELVEKIQIQVPDVINNTPEEEKIKLNLGCGNDIKKGYVNIDKYNNTGAVDFQFDISDLSYFDNESVDEIFTSHVFEHISINDIYAVINEWKRVLKPGGKLVLYLPDLEHEIKVWLDTPDKDKWFHVHRIFGGQTHPGNTHFCGFNPGSLKSFLESFNFIIETNEIGNRGYGPEIQCTAVKQKDHSEYNTTYNISFVDGPFAEVRGHQEDKSYYQIDFLDPDSEAHVHQSTLKINCWARPHRKWFTNWLIQIRKNGKFVFEHKFDLTGKRVLISIDSRSLGDTIAWIPYVEEFRKQYNCHVVVSTFWNNLFMGHEYFKNILFVKPGSIVNNLYASYLIGAYDNDWNKNKENWRTIPLQKVASDILGLEYREIITPLSVKINERPINEKYITLSEHSTFQCKYWNHENGWQQIVDWFNENGYRVVVISKEETQLKNIVDRTNQSIEDTINTIAHSEMFLGVSSGPAWLSWSLGIPVVMISGYSSEWAEFKSGIKRIINKDVCNSCFNDVNNFFDRGQWDWCPRHKGTGRQYECTKSITPERVIKNIKTLMKK